MNDKSVKMSEENMNQLGKILSGIGGASFLIGMLFSFHCGMLVFANILFFVGIFFIVGLERGKKLFTRKKAVPGTCLLVIGFIATFINHGFYGSFLQLLGASIVFNGFIPYITARIRKIPVIGPILAFNFGKFAKKKDEDLLPMPQK